MTYLDEWRALSARIQSLVTASEIHARHMAVNSGDSYSRARRLIEHAQSALAAIRAFSGRYQKLLPAPVLASIARLLEQAGPLVLDATGATRDDKASTSILLLGLFQSEISLLLADGRATILARCERAFEHLRRLLIVDPATRTLWEAAYDDSEPACERLGATHLLHHGLWTFKADAVGARTDLMYAEPVDIDQAVRSDAGLVLTEWKRADKKAKPENITRLFAAAREQARRYAEGSLAGFELADYRYLVLVSLEDVVVPPDIPIDGVLYRHINIPLAASVPSKRRARGTN